MLAPIINFLRVHKMPDIVFREVTGNNIPHVAIVRNKDELIDQSICQFGNTAAYFGSGLVLDKAFTKLRQAAGLRLTPKTRGTFYLGKSAAIYSAIAGVLLAMPMLRNYVTTSRTQTTHYADMIGEAQRGPKQPSWQQQWDVQEKLADYRTRGLKTLGTGLALSAGFTALTATALKRRMGLSHGLKLVQKHIGLKDGRFKNFSPLSAVLFWVTPTFSGFLLGARDPYEVKEIALRFAAFNFAFFIFPMTVEKMIDKAAKKMRPTRLFGPSRNLAYAGKFVSSLLLCSAIPTVVNIYLTRQRIRRDGLQARA